MTIFFSQPFSVVKIKHCKYSTAKKKICFSFLLTFSKNLWSWEDIAKPFLFSISLCGIKRNIRAKEGIQLIWQKPRVEHLLFLPANICTVCIQKYASYRTYVYILCSIMLPIGHILCTVCSIMLPFGHILCSIMLPIGHILCSIILHR